MPSKGPRVTSTAMPSRRYGCASIGEGTENTEASNGREEWFDLQPGKPIADQFFVP